MTVELCNCAAPTGTIFCDNCGFLLTDEAQLDIDLVPESLYIDILSEFKKKYGQQFNFVEWSITAYIK